MPVSRSRSWKMERAGINRKSNDRSRSNKYSHGDKRARPGAGSRSRIWVGGYRRADGTSVKGYYRAQS